MALHKTRIDIPAAKREKLVKLLNERLADLIDLKLQCKQAHWNVKGPNFIALHELFDKQAEVVAGHVDEVAERITTLGGTADGGVATVAKRTSLSAYPQNLMSGMKHVDALATAFATVGKVVRKAIDEADELEDADTADLFTGVSRDLDQQLWFLEAHLQGTE
ncbi:MAG TPA: DNA starvation/stationary phase protection protein Dps [Caulifigura sp.]|jgi:starvation-inducible DNA-binding protein|nr:DNA starvation/stationary phase protection protein Dps [Caulifigura sp.]